MNPDCDVAIIGAGPYGLSIAAHLRARGVSFRIFGRPMQTWQTQMLRDSHLKSDGFASSLYEPSGRFTLKRYCLDNNLPYHDTDLPVARSIFARYALAFQKQFVPQLEQRDIADLQRVTGGFTLRTVDGERIGARRVVIAVGISRFHYLPPVLDRLPREYATHSSMHTMVDRFAGEDVVVIGAGASAVDTAKELIGVGARVRLVARGAAILFHDPPRKRTLRDKLRAPSSGLGPGWRSRLSTDAPLLFHAMPEWFRVRVVQRHLGPAPCWFTRDAVEGKAEFMLQRELRDAKVRDGRVTLRLEDAAGRVEEIEADHVIGATGFRVDLKRIEFLPDEVLESLAMCDTSPALSRNFESNIRGLYFVGTAAANSFGPVSRFAFGAGFTARRLSRHLSRTAPRTWRSAANQQALEPVGP